MISKNKIKYIHSLENKKGRDSQGMFVAEGPKVVADILALHKEKLRMLVGTKEWLDNNMKLIPKNAGCEIVEVTNEELSKTSLLCHPQQVLAVFEKLNTQIDINDIAMKLTLVTDGVQDPGNLGTIIRIADWFGIENMQHRHGGRIQSKGGAGNYGKPGKGEHHVHGHGKTLCYRTVRPSRLRNSVGRQEHI